MHKKWILLPLIGLFLVGACPIPGLVILASKRHFYRMDELTDEESKRYIELVTRIRREQRNELGIEHVYYFITKIQRIIFISGWCRGMSG
jgi:hypothetical protein